MRNPITPSILNETRSGLCAHSISDEMFRRREIMLSDDITQQTADSLVSQLIELAHEDPKGEITFYINSSGGEVASGLALYDVMQSVPCPIRTVCVGKAASMAALLFAAGDTRDILPHAYVMIHDPLIGGGGLSGSALSIRSESDLLMRIRETMCELLAKHTGKTLDEIYEKTATDSYFYAEDAVGFGLADRVITTLVDTGANEKPDSRKQTDDNISERR